MIKNCLYRSFSSVYRQKVTYQRNMLIGFVIAALVVIIPTVLWAYWPVEDPVTIIIEEHKADTVYVRIDFDKEIQIIKDEGSGGPRNPNPDGSGAMGLFVEDLNIYQDDAELEFEVEGFAGNVGDGESEIVDVFSGSFGNGTGGLLMKEDDRSYLITDSLDRIPEMIYIPDPVYPPLAQKADGRFEYPV